MESQASPTLRPLRFGELLDQAIRLYRGHFLTFIGIVAVVYVPITILQSAATLLMAGSMFGISSSSPEEMFSNPGYWIGILSTFVFVFVQFFLVQGVATGALARAVGDNYLGRKTGIVDAYRGIGKSWISLVGALLFIGLLNIVAALWWFIVPCVGWFTGAGMIVFLMGAIFPMTAPVVVLEGQSAVDSVRRAWSLARRRFWPLLGYTFVLYLFSLIIVQGPVAIMSGILTATMQSFDDPTTSLLITTIAQSLVGLVASLIYIPLQMAAFTLIYFDLRVRTEGFDIALSTMQLDPSNNSQVMPAPPPPADERLMTWADLGNFAILTLGALSIYVLVFSILMGGIFLFSGLF
jgi:Membrane domain of glycerophosphoryl diester phosphodiesterase